jgi:uncharacterized protein
MAWLDRIRTRRDDARPIASGSTAIMQQDGIGGRWVNSLTGQGGVLDRHATTEFVPPLPLPMETGDAIMEYEAIGRRVIDREPEDATREGYTLKTDPGIGRDLIMAAEGAPESGIEGLGLLNAVCDARRWSRGFGGGAVIVVADDGQDFDQPLNRAGLRAIRSLLTADRFELSVARYGLDPNDATTFGKPSHYHWTSAGSGRSVVIHASRVVPFHGVRLSPRAELRNNGWGGSVLHLVWAHLRNYGSSLEYCTEALSVMSQGVFKQKFLAEAADRGDSQMVADRIEAMRVAMGLLGDIAIDADHESYEILARPLSGIGEAMETLATALVAATGMPRVILFGETPGGINSGEQAAEILAWYDHVKTLQRKLYTGPVMRLLTLLAASKEGPTGGLVPEGWSLQWQPLWQLSEEEREAMQLTRAQRRQTDITSGVITVDEARRERALVELYGIDPYTPAPVNPTEEPVELQPELDDESELAPVTPAPLTAMPKGETLIGAQEAARRLGVSPGTVHAMAGRGAFPAWRVGSRWRYAWSLIESATSVRPAANGVH